MKVLKQAFKDMKINFENLEKENKSLKDKNESLTKDMEE